MESLKYYANIPKLDKIFNISDIEYAINLTF